MRYDQTPHEKCKRRLLMAVSVSGISPGAHLPLILGMLRTLEVAVLIDDMLPSHPDNVISCGRGVEALVLAILDGDHALYKVGSRLEERGVVPRFCRKFAFSRVLGAVSH
jgi:Domain of unknown function (DUF4277)